MKIQFACLLLLLLSATVICEHTFHEKHVIEEADGKDCTKILESRNLFASKKHKGCKHSMKFVVESDGQTVNSVCAGGVKKGKSKKPFQILKCKLDKKSTFPKCVYTTESRNHFSHTGCLNYWSFPWSLCCLLLLC
uniref:Ribonuclease A-domain domain-containing protein n=1 Tax=Anabas testudineus TaxID=64144 RepID=A0A7N6BW17_ANATE